MAVDKNKLEEQIELELVKDNLLLKHWSAKQENLLLLSLQRNSQLFLV